MSANYNSIDLLGNLGNDPEEFFLPNGIKGAKFSVAVNQVWMDAAGQRHEETDWFRVTVRGGLAETCLAYLSKGRQVFVTGIPRLRRWEDENKGKHEQIQVLADKVIFLGSPELKEDN
jgi:single-strand DNA-binding protein